ncbi:metal-dependent hydrolase [Caldimonas thermodepolymerans]|jgi:Predicted membrane-bound metal-dependent hydrolases|uniref:Hydrolase n=1 Tax=Caldimonas thermodepolymerans TaxID=215580 RepID=A0A2S5T392_9BURK|nr:metal-dependent hydrolase [Caldimonas thermodepolymerans]PPE69347.1 hydrolase [Caldimonas thermodepolymerans]QPC31074.1 metal-dependent hydrolase [Caldimonas thermodepolymerans]RDH96198.1 inner membrane protein [Caldimonas thermodepolymerans]TCP04118.1 inner membrane protein [Caldimonas thermodepolymerans]UZG47466.1 metal-dependent hydrolase [Caldimonas thermodepolymerans]
MDSLTQIALGASVSVAVMGRRTAAWKAALWGGICGTLPDLDAFIDHGDPVRNMTLHRGDSHALFWLTLATPLLAAAIARLHGEQAQWRRWGLAVWLALVTHPLLDLMTVYGTQLLRPFSEHPYGVGSIFIIDPLYTVPLLAGLVVAMRSRRPGALRWNLAGLAFSTAYLGWSVVAQQHVAGIARASLHAQGVQAARLLVTPTAFNTVLWRVVAVTPDGYLEGFRSLLDREPQMQFERFARGDELYRDRLAPASWHARRLAWFTHGFYKVERHGDELRMTDLRMGQEPYYTFTFVLAERRDGQDLPVTPRLVSQRPALREGFTWLWLRAQGLQVPPPR